MIKTVWEKIGIWGFTILAIVGLIVFSLWKTNLFQSTDKPVSTSGHLPNNPTYPKIAWGFDTVHVVNSSFYKKVETNYGKPVFVGRYMTTKQGVYSGLTKSEIKNLHHKGIKILPIYDHFTNAKSSSQGKKVAQQAIQQAKRLGIPKGTYIVADIEINKPVDYNFLISWTKTLLNAGYKPGIYGNFSDGSINGAYKQAIQKSKQVNSHLMIWTDQPIIGVTGKAKAPKQFKAKSPNLKETFVWQYGINGRKSNIDSDLINGKILRNLW